MKISFLINLFKLNFKIIKFILIKVGIGTPTLNTGAMNVKHNIMYFLGPSNEPSNGIEF
jgi:hypothetical protein